MIKHRLSQIKRYRFTQIILLVTLACCWQTPGQAGYWLALSGVEGLLVTNCYADSISSEELIQNAREYDGKEIVFQGEVIGDIMKRGNFCWVNISDGKKALGVFLDILVLSNIMFTGDYDHRGDIVEVKGVFHRACLEHGGDLDIHATKITKLKNGYRIIHKTDQKKVKVVLWLTVILFGLIVVAIIKKVIRSSFSEVSQ